MQPIYAWRVAEVEFSCYLKADNDGLTIIGNRAPLSRLSAITMMPAVRSVATWKVRFLDQ